MARKRLLFFHRRHSFHVLKQVGRWMGINKGSWGRGQDKSAFLFLASCRDALDSQGLKSLAYS